MSDTINLNISYDNPFEQPGVSLIATSTPTLPVEVDDLYHRVTSITFKKEEDVLAEDIVPSEVGIYFNSKLPIFISSPDLQLTTKIGTPVYQFATFRNSEPQNEPQGSALGKEFWYSNDASNQRRIIFDSSTAMNPAALTPPIYKQKRLV